ncbi:MAG: hypothetical protein K0S43_879 [Cellulosimicrobium sp.]|nr:hypothetical protein [Cellulosimicrobium sp.]
MVHDGWGPRWAGTATTVAASPGPWERPDPVGPVPRRTRRRRLGRRAAAAVSLLLVLAVAWVAWLVADALRARDALERAAAELPTLQEQVRAGQDTSVALAEVRRSAHVAASSTRGPHWALARALPVLGDDARALGEVATAVEAIADDALPRLADAAAVASPTLLAPRNGAVDLRPLEEARDDVVSADRSVARAIDAVSAIDPSSLVAPLATAVTGLREQLAEVHAQTATAARAVELVPPMLGADAPRDYLVLVQNNAEPRAAGGIAGSVLHVRAEDGAVRLVEVRAGSALGASATSVVGLSGAEDALFGDDLGRFMLNVTSTPDFPRTAEVARATWRDRTGLDVDGVLSVDPVALGRVLAATGPVTVADPAGGEIRLSGDDASAFLLNGVYRSYPDPTVQDVVLSAVAEQVFAGLGGGGADPGRLVGALAESAREGRLLVWSSDADEQERLSGTVLSGELRGRLTDASGEETSPVVGVFLNATTAAKVGYYLDTTVAIDDVRCRPDGSQSFTLTVTLTSILSPDDAASLPTYVSGADGDGTIRTNLLVYAPAHGGIEGATGPDGDLGLFSQVHEGLVVGARSVAVGPGQTATFGYEVVSGKDQRGSVSVRKTPGARPVTDTVPASQCTEGVFS